MSEAKIVGGGKLPSQHPMMLVRMRCEACGADHRMLVSADTPLGALPQITKETFRCHCKRHIPKITTMSKSLMSINGVPFRELQGLFATAHLNLPGSKN